MTQMNNSLSWMKKSLRIKYKILSRLVKEFESYQIEESLQKKRIDALRKKLTVAVDEKDEMEHVINKQQEVLKETVDMLPDTLTRMRKAHAELIDLLEKCRSIVEKDQEFADLISESETSIENYSKLIDSIEA